MKTMIFSSASSIWKETLRSIMRLIGFGKLTQTGPKPAIVIYGATVGAKKSMLTIRMALNPGEIHYSEVAARIKSEAAAYEEFLRDPKKVGRIVLNVKQFKGREADTCVSREQYRINEPWEGLTDPAEGRASVWYRFARSQNKVLEFVVHDEHDTALFPLVRTYTDWTGNKEIDLGFDRKLYLMMAGEAGYVDVRAGFTPVSEAEKFANLSPQRPELVAAGGVSHVASRLGGPFYSSALRLPANAIAYALVAILLLGAVAVVRRLEQKVRAEANIPSDSRAMSAKLNEVPPNPVSLVPLLANPAVHSAILDGQSLRSDERDKLLRLADIRRFKVSVDRKLCQGKCLKVLKGIQQQLKSRFDGLSLPPAAREAADVNKPSASLVVSYSPLNTERGKIQVTLSDHEGSLWNVGHDFDHILNDDTRAMDLYTEQFSSEVLLTVFRAKDQCLSETAKSPASEESTK
jgi:hypothetical protein